MTHEQTFDRAYWEDRYGAPGLAWSGAPNAVLVTEATPLTPGRALDIGSGEGGDAIWLALRGWTVTGVDIAVNALDKARARAEVVDEDAASRIRWEQHDLTDWAPEKREFDLVTAHFMHLADPERSTLFRSLAAAVAPGGSLLIVGHDLSGVQDQRAHMTPLMFGVDDVLEAIAGEELRVEVAESRERTVVASDGSQTAMRDVVVRASRP
jgi:2-polyprenyl-3-methyl-5-hydroxy-6-metoxy-1,4-benzoquinol methylase